MGVICGSLLFVSCATVVDPGLPVSTMPVAHVLPAVYNLSVLPLDDPQYSGNKAYADAQIVSQDLQLTMEEVIQGFRQDFPNAYKIYSIQELRIIFSALLYDELFRRDISDTMDDTALLSMPLSQSLLKRTLGIAQINPSIHIESIREATGNFELSLEDAAQKLLDTKVSLKTMSIILYKNHPQDIILAMSRYHAGNTTTHTERAIYLQSAEFLSYIQGLLKY